MKNARPQQMPPPGVSRPRIATPTIVVGLDDSRPSWDAFSWALGEATRCASGLLAVHVSPPPGWGISGSLFNGDCYAIEVEAERAMVENLRRKAQRGADDSGVQVRFVSTTGDVATELVRMAQEIGADLLVVGRSTKLVHHIAGSVGRRLANTVAAPAVVVVP